MTSTCYTFPYIALRHYPWPHSLEPRANCISCRQMSYFSLLRELSRQKKTFHFSLPRMIDCPQTSKRQNIGTNNYYEVESFSSFNRLHNLPWFPPPTAEFLLCDGEMHFRVMSVHSLVRWPHFSYSFTRGFAHIRNVKSISCLHFCRDSLHFVPVPFYYILFYTTNAADKEPIIFW